MKTTKWLVAGLIALNAILGLAVYQRFGVENKAFAQAGARKDILSVSGYVNGQSYLYMWDTNGGMMVVVKPDPVNKKFEAIAKKDIASDLARIK